MEINKNSGQVEIISEYGRVYLYTHSHSDKLISDVFSALSARVRWDDPDYLSKIVFCHMIPMECWQDEVGYGIGTLLYADVDLLISLDVPKQIISITSALDKGFRYCGSFENFVDGYSKQAKF
jgi:hypothetical protein